MRRAGPWCVKGSAVMEKEAFGKQRRTGINARQQPMPQSKKRCNISVAALCYFGVADGARTHDNRNHNPGLYQLSYSHRSFVL